MYKIYIFFFILGVELHTLYLLLLIKHIYKNINAKNTLEITINWRL